tara:strand:- start:827 stop:1276 length:450 start_codon:yes stop_codon:yes gene_type:complete
MNDIISYYSGIKNVTSGENVKVVHPVNLYGCTLGDDVFVGPFVEIQENVIIKKGARISSHSFIPSGVTIGENTFVAHGVMFVNDKFDSRTIQDWILRPTIVGKNVRIGSNATILPVRIGNNAIIGAGAVVTRDVPEGKTVYGNPARIRN